MSLGKVRARFLIAGAWLTGAGVATAVCLYAVSLLGQGILGPSSQQLTVAAVNRALASETAQTAATSPAPSSPAAPPSRSRPRPSPSPSPSSRHTAGKSSHTGTLLTSSGGSVVAACARQGAYLLSWSPQQGYQAVSVVRGPASQAQVTFQSGSTEVIVAVVCRGGVPVATAAVDNSRGDDGQGS